jgi:hypothetical protein
MNVHTLKRSSAVCIHVHACTALLTDSSLFYVIRDTYDLFFSRDLTVLYFFTTVHVRRYGIIYDL